MKFQVRLMVFLYAEHVQIRVHDIKYNSITNINA